MSVMAVARWSSKEPLAAGDCKTSQPILDRLATSAGPLQLEEIERASTTGNTQLASAGSEHGAWRRCMVDLDRLCRPDLQQQLRFAHQPGPGPWDRVEGADAIGQIAGRQRPIKPLIAALDAGGVADACERLRVRLKAAEDKLIDRLDDQLRAELGQAVVERATGLRLADRQRAGQQHRAGIEARIHLHDRDAGLSITSLDRPLDRGGPTPAGQQRRVDIDATETRHLQHDLRQDQAIGGDHHQICLEPGDGGLRRVILQACRLQDRQAQRTGAPLDCWLVHLLTATGRLIRPTEHGNQSVAGRGERIEDANRKVRRTGKHQAQGRVIVHQGIQRERAVRQSAARRALGERPVRSRERVGSGDLTVLFLQLGPDPALLEPRQMLNEHLAVEMIDLVLQADCEKALGFEGEGLTVAIERTHSDACWSIDLLEETWDRQATLFVAAELAAHRHELRVDEDLQLIARFGQVDHDHATVHVDLSCSKADARRVIHGLGHVIDQ